MSCSFLNQVKGFLTNSVHMLNVSFGRCLPLYCMFILMLGENHKGTHQLEILSALEALSTLLGCRSFYYKGATSLG